MHGWAISGIVESFDSESNVVVTVGKKAVIGTDFLLAILKLVITVTAWQ